MLRVIINGGGEGGGEVGMDSVGWIRVEWG